MKLSILDQSPIITGKTSREALLASVELVKSAEQLGYTRYWIAEHHGTSTLASSVPEVMLGYIGANTKKIKIGCGAVLLPHYKPYRVAETYNMLQTLFPNRIDLGIGRAPGGSAEASIALSGNFLENVKKMPESISDLTHFINNDFPENHFYSSTIAAPLPEYPPDIWILGTSIKSAKLAAETGAAYAFGYFMSDNDGVEIVQTYQQNFKSRNGDSEPYTIVTVAAICAETNEKAMKIREKTKSTIQQNSDEKKLVERRNEKVIVGNPNSVKEQLKEIKEIYQADEIMIVTITDDYQERLTSYELIANHVLT
ncbi:LLM class flavin-dependent oxidoreductase [Aquibacillus saliphilus]|uniref:LLM class flavin-dependent oxidoreductase n=1 Tax=Aquibacillus saliphilus TaxID=1909422 RepID=UPI001CF0353F|nr:LLM class flavin-dependent oxidoreductase [Aquibacillus saliphilus]